MLKRWTARGLHIVRGGYKRTTFFLVATFLVVSSIVSFSLAPSAQAADIGSASSLGSSVGGSSISTCAIETVGWVICPVMRTIAKLADYGFSFVNINFLKIDYSITQPDSGVFTAWQLMLTIANVAFVLVFLFIIYSQITGRNAGGYNIKRILPRLIIGALLVNVSYYLCAAAIQLSNIAGSLTLDIMKTVTDRIGTPAMSLDNAANGFKDGVLTDLTSSVLTKSGTVWILMAPIAAVIISIAVVSAAAIVLLIARKVIVAMLVLVSPLLFVTYLLPNIEHYFQQWLRLFTQLLLLFPVVAFLLGTGQIISATIISVGSSGETSYAVKNDSYQAKSGGSGSATTDLAACAAAVLPLLGVWFVMKGLSSVMTTAGTKLAANVGGRGRGNKERAEKLQAQAKLNKPGLTPGGIPGAGFDRKPAFSRLAGRRHKASLGGSASPLGRGNEQPHAPGAARQPQPSQTLASTLDNLLKTEKPQEQQTANIAAAQAAQMAAELNGANINADNANATGSLAAAKGDAKQKDEKEGKTAKDIFNNMNKTHDSKDQGRSFSSGPPAAGGEGSSGAQPGHANDYRAPSMAQPLSAPAAPQPSSHRGGGGPVTVITTPVNIDASALLGNNPAAIGVGQHQPPTTAMQQKAKARAQKYLFDAATDTETAADRLEALNDKLKDEEDQADAKKDS